MHNLITILGPTASGKTSFATALASEFNTEIISADSRQVYRAMNLGTGKDLSEYNIEGKIIPYHLIDIVNPGYKYNVFEFKRDFFRVFQEITATGKIPIFCGGTGLYLEAVLKNYKLLNVPENKELRIRLADKTLTELTELLGTYKNLHNTKDVDSPKRAIRAIEIADFQQKEESQEQNHPSINSIIIGLDIPRENRRAKITKRLKERLEQGMVEEVRGILATGVTPEDLIYYGLEYKYLTHYILGNLTYDEMFSQLEVAIHQFAKRQMTCFRGMEKRGFNIHWIDALLPMEEKLKQVEQILKDSNL